MVQVLPSSVAWHAIPTVFSEHARSAWHGGVSLVAKADDFINFQLQKTVSPILETAMARSTWARNFVERKGANPDSSSYEATRITTFWAGVSLMTGLSAVYAAVPQAQPVLEGFFGDGAALVYHGTVLTALVASLRLQAAFYSAACAQSPAGEEFGEALAAAPTLNEWTVKNTDVRETVLTLERRLRDDPRFLEFLGYDPASFVLSDVLGNSRVLEGLDLYGESGINRAYSGHDACTVINLSDRGVLVHELLHLLHFKAIKKAMDASAIDRLLKTWERFIPNDYPLPGKIRSALFTLRARDPDREPTEAQRQAGMEVFVCYVELTGEAEYLEAVASRYLYGFQAAWASAIRLLGLITYPAVSGMAFLGGTYFSNRSQSTELAYNFPGYANRFFSRGLLGGMGTPE